MTAWTAEKQRTRWHRLKAEGRCPKCTGLMLPEWAGFVHCPECREKRVEDVARYNRTEKGLARSARWRAAKRLDPVFRRKDWDRIIAGRLAKKLAGICRSCPEPSLNDSNFCEPCRDKARKSNREAQRRRRAKLAGKVVAAPRKRKRKARIIRLRTRLIGKPIEPKQKPVTVGERVLRAASHFGDTFRNEDIREATGMSSNHVSVVLRRLRLNGAIRMVAGSQGSNDTEYQIVQEHERWRAA